MYSYRAEVLSPVKGRWWPEARGPGREVRGARSGARGPGATFYDV